MAIELILADDWRQVAPRPVGKRLAWESAAHLYHAETDFTTPIDCGRVGDVDTPIVSHEGALFRYACQLQSGGQDFSDVLRVPVAQGCPERFRRLRTNQWIPWLLCTLPRRGALLGLIATHMPGRGVVIRHQLGFMPFNDARLRVVNLPTDALAPLAVCPMREEIFFYGASGCQRVDFSGKSIQKLDTIGQLSGKGADYHPSEPWVALGGGGLSVYSLRAQKAKRLSRTGVQPRWSRDGRGLWHFYSSSELCYYDRKREETRQIAALPEVHHREANYARGVVQCSEGRYMAASLTRKRRLSGQEVARMKAAQRAGLEPVNSSLFTYEHWLAIFDLEAHECWTHRVHARNLCWVE